MVADRTANVGAWTGWIVFAGVMMLVLGMINTIEGLVALFADEELVLVADRLFVVDLTGWGWTLLIFGILLMAVGFGLMAAQTWARITGIVLVGLHAVVQVVWLGAYPIWSLLMIALDTVLLYALTARWSAVKQGLDRV